MAKKIPFFLVIITAVFFVFTANHAFADLCPLSVCGDYSNYHCCGPEQCCLTCNSNADCLGTCNLNTHECEGGVPMPPLPPEPPPTPDPSVKLCATNAECGAHAHCITLGDTRSCQCTGNYDNCDASWANGCEADISSNSKNCGACGTQCSLDQKCTSFNCVDNPITKCTDANQCGGINNSADCSTGGYCVCLFQMSNCDQSWANGCETYANTTKSCGACGASCPAGEQCINRQCSGTTPNPPPSQDCGGKVCWANSSCVDNNCVCNSGFADCDGSAADGCEVDLSSDPSNCGYCNNACTPGDSCGAGQCGARSSQPPEIPPGSNCGGKICGPNTYCFEGECKCAYGTKNCDGNWANGCECGSSYTACQGNQCVCQPSFYDCDGNVYNGCETSRPCPVCTPKQSRSCSTVDVCNGKQTCGQDGYWGSCNQVGSRACTPYSTAKCSPVINGKACSTLTGSKQCNSCGSRYGSCGVSSDAICCPGTKDVCIIGSCSGTKSCSADGKSQGDCVSGDTTCCEKDADCNDFNGCTTEKCTNNRCEYSPVEDCHSLTPVKCKTDQNCASKDSCVNGECTALQCNEKFTIENHKCVCGGKECGGQCYFTDGTCCGDFWNEGFSGCTFDFGYYDERVKLSKDSEAASLLGQAKDLATSGDLRKASVVAKIAIVKAELTLSSESVEIKNQAADSLKQAKELLVNGNYSSASDKADEAMNLLEGKNVQVATNSESLWQKNKVPIVAFSSVIVVLLVFIFYVIVTPKI